MFPDGRNDDPKNVFLLLWTDGSISHYLQSNNKSKMALKAAVHDSKLNKNSGNLGNVTFSHYITVLLKCMESDYK